MPDHTRAARQHISVPLPPQDRHVRRGRDHRRVHRAAVTGSMRHLFRPARVDLAAVSSGTGGNAGSTAKRTDRPVLPCRCGPADRGPPTATERRYCSSAVLDHGCGAWRMCPPGGAATPGDRLGERSWLWQLRMRSNRPAHVAGTAMACGASRSGTCRGRRGPLEGRFLSPRMNRPLGPGVVLARGWRTG
jgi:hypothetical protein